MTVKYIEMNKVYESVEHMAKSIQDHEQRSCHQVDVIIALSRGGLTLGTILSHATGVKMIPLVWSLRDHADLSVSTLIHALNGIKSVVIVDEINDSGKTLKSIDGVIKSLERNDLDVLYLTMHSKPSSIFKPDNLVTFEESPDNEWLVYPWERYMVGGKIVN